MSALSCGIVHLVLIMKKPGIIAATLRDVRRREAGLGVNSKETDTLKLEQDHAVC
jgi:hypothetical protein